MTTMFGDNLKMSLNHPPKEHRAKPSNATLPMVIATQVEDPEIPKVASLPARNRTEDVYDIANIARNIDHVVLDNLEDHETALANTATGVTKKYERFKKEMVKKFLELPMILTSGT